MTGALLHAGVHDVAPPAGALHRSVVAAHSRAWDRRRMTARARSELRSVEWVQRQRRRRGIAANPPIVDRQGHRRLPLAEDRASRLAPFLRVEGCRRQRSASRSPECRCRWQSPIDFPPFRRSCGSPGRSTRPFAVQRASVRAARPSAGRRGCRCRPRWIREEAVERGQKARDLRPRQLWAVRAARRKGHAQFRASSPWFLPSRSRALGETSAPICSCPRPCLRFALPRAAAAHLSLGSVPLALEERSVDEVFCNEHFQGLTDALRHGNRLHQVVPGLCRRFTF